MTYPPTLPPRCSPRKAEFCHGWERWSWEAEGPGFRWKTAQRPGLPGEADPWPQAGRGVQGHAVLSQKDR